MKDAIYNYDRAKSRILDRIVSSNICEGNKKALLDFHRECVIHGLSNARIVKYLDTLFRIAQWFDTTFQEVTKDDVADIVQRIESNGYSEWTKRDYKIMLKIFFRWFRKSESYPDEVRWIKSTAKTRNKLPEEILSPEEIMRMVDAADNLRDKAFVLVLYESGCRIGELLTLQLKHVQFDSFGAVLIVNGKTGQRRVRVILSAPKLSQWVENHPLRSNPDAALWVTIGTRRRNTVLTYPTAKDTLRNLAEKCGIGKRVHPHLFRHSRATHLANYLTEAQMKQYFGWVQASDMASVYVHLSGRDVDNALFKLNGMQVTEDRTGQELKPLVCPRCRSRNSPDAKFCINCGLCLDARTAVQIDVAREKADRLITELVEKPEVLNSLLRAVANTN
ncbi:MAG: site-specific integrase [Candidatus Bathyarchaeota archaeon]|nr:site-specific integrase [Candidatus Bathyarchaeota archaeon]